MADKDFIKAQDEAGEKARKYWDELNKDKK
jgi:hypothetical protein